ncbi:CobW family GTP-binding protein [Ottowia thiooxydans]|uniref:CobW family GTP-binding protein n=1 Tax=Ottowia thiooxydans TaxID=219182 RepID=UPI00040C1FB0|nr:GTP-binding protein [Ottowia thiooxydans]
MSSDRARIPVALLTGFLGSGKTTLLNRWLREPALANAAVIVNEFGDIGIDHNLIASSNDNTIELSTGCLCCTVQGDLVETLRDLLDKRSRGAVRAFDRVVIETTGMADPGPVLQALMTFPVANGYRLAQVITTVDGVNGATTLNRFPESAKQVSVADQLVITKMDLANSQQAQELQSQLELLNPGATVSWATHLQVPCLEVLTELDVYAAATPAPAIRRWLNAEAYADHTRYQPITSESAGHHSEGIETFSLVYDEPLAWQELAAWLDALVMAHGDDLLRVKGILNIAGESRPIVVHAVQRLFHPPAPLAEWPYEDRRSRLVFITRGLSRAFVENIFDVIRGRAIPSSRSSTTAQKESIAWTL